MWLRLLPARCLVVLLPLVVMSTIEAKPATLKDAHHSSTTHAPATSTRPPPTTPPVKAQSSQDISDKDVILHDHSSLNTRVFYPPNLMPHRHRRATLEIPEDYGENFRVSKRLPVVKRPSYFRDETDQHVDQNDIDEAEQLAARILSELQRSNIDHTLSNHRDLDYDQRISEFLQSVVDGTRDRDAEESMFKERNDLKMAKRQQEEADEEIQQIQDDDAFERALAAVQQKYDNLEEQELRARLLEADYKDEEYPREQGLKKDAVLRYNSGYPTRYFAPSEKRFAKKKRFPVQPVYSNYYLPKRLRTSEEVPDVVQEPEEDVSQREDDENVQMLLSNPYLQYALRYGNPQFKSSNRNLWEDEEESGERLNKREANPGSEFNNDFIDLQDYNDYDAENDNDVTISGTGGGGGHEYMPLIANEERGIKRRKRRDHGTKAHKRVPRQQQSLIKELNSVFSPDESESKTIKKREGSGAEFHNTPSPTVSNNTETTTTSHPTLQSTTTKKLNATKNKQEAQTSATGKNKLLKRRKKSSSWDDSFGIDKKSRTKRTKKSPDSINDGKSASSSTDDKAVNKNKLHEWAVNNYYKQMARALTSRRKRRADPTWEEAEVSAERLGNNPLLFDSEGDDVPLLIDTVGDSPLNSIDRKIKVIEDIILREALDIVDEEQDEERTRRAVLDHLEAAHSLEKMRKALDEFQESLDRIKNDVIV